MLFIHHIFNLLGLSATFNFNNLTLFYCKFNRFI